MARQCYFCKKKYKKVTRRVKLRGKYNPTAKRKQKPNLHFFVLPSGKRVKACAKCIKTLIKKRGVG